MQTNGALAALSPRVGAGAEIQPPAAGRLHPVWQRGSVLRLSVPVGALALLQQAPIIVQHARNRGVVHRLETIYYDTSDHALFGHGMSLRVQRHGKRFTQTLRHHGLGEQIPGIQTWQAPVDSRAPDLSCLAGIDAGTLPDCLESSPLLALFETRLRRQTRRLDLGGALVDVAFDDGVIETDSRQETLTEIALALQSGEPGVLYEIGMRLLELAPLRIASAGTVRRGYAMLSAAPPKAAKAAPSGVTRALAVDDMIGVVLAGCQAHLQANLLVAEDGRSPDGVHQMRVALRRMRSALSLLRREMPSPTMGTLAAEAKWAADQLGPARGWDVFLGTTLAAPQRAGTQGTDFAALRQAAELRRAPSYQAVRALLAAPRFGRFQLASSQWVARRGWRNEVDRAGLAVLAEPASAMASRVLTRLHRRALRQGAHFERLGAGERHELRITLKKLRYAAEFFLPLCAAVSQTPRYLARLARLQDALGLDHDAATTQPLLDEAARASNAPGLHQAIGLVIGWQARDCLAAGEALAKHWRRFKDTPTFWARPAEAAEAARPRGAAP